MLLLDYDKIISKYVLNWSVEHFGSACQNKKNWKKNQSRHYSFKFIC